MNVYDAARGLADSIKKSEEFTHFSDMKKKVEGNAELVDMLNDFQGKQIELQKKQVLGQQPDADFVKQVQELYGIMMKDPLAAEYLQAELRFSLMLNDVYKILGDVMGLSSMVK